MNFEEHAAKPLLAPAGIAVPAGEVVGDAAGAGRAAAKLGPCVVKAQVPAGRRGKAGGIRAAATPAEAEAAARAILGRAIGGHPVERLLVERRIAVQRELYAAVLTDAGEQGAADPGRGRGRHRRRGAGGARSGRSGPHPGRHPPRHRRRADRGAPRAARAPSRGWSSPRSWPGSTGSTPTTTSSWSRSIRWRSPPTAPWSRSTASSCSTTRPPPRRPELAALASPEPRTPLEQRAQAHGLRLIELDGDVGVLANGAGLTMTTMDAVRHHGGAPANFLEIGGEAYRLGRPALELVLANPRVRSLVVNFCGAFARTDVMADAITQAWQALRPRVPVFFSIHGTGEDEAVALVRERLGLEPFDLMDDAVRAAVAAAAGAGR